MKKIAKQCLPEMLEKMASAYQVYAPLENGGEVNFARWSAGAQTELAALKTAVPAKSVLFPQHETYLRFARDGKQLSIETVGGETEDFVLFGVRACDAKSFALLDKVFLSEPADQFYASRREHGTVVAFACAEPEETCFCRTFAIAAQAPAGADVCVWEAGEVLLWQAMTAKGERLTSLLDDSLAEAGAAEQATLAKVQAEIRQQLDELPLAQLAAITKKQDLKQVFADESWLSCSEACLGCGACTYVCPTCHCYDIHDFDAGDRVERSRCWDSCMFSDFTQMAHGNPRTTQKERFRQRFMHKLVYYPDNYGEIACVGCGRCLEACPVNMNIVKVMKTIGGEA